MLPTIKKQHLLFLDAETYYDDVYSLRKMPTPNYILDPRFELIMMAVKVVDLSIGGLGELAGHEIVDGPDFGEWIKQFDPETTTTVTFNALFDNSILAWRYGFVPKRMLDAMGMARALLGHQLTSFSLRAVADYMHLGHKGTALANMKGLRREQIIERGLWPSFCDYATQDNFLTEQIFYQLYQQFPPEERRVMDLVLRTTVQPRFQVDVPLLEAHLEDVRAQKELLLQAANNVDRTVLMSTVKFKAALEARGVEVEMKVSPTSGLETPAFAKTDEFMEKLQDHADPEIAAMAVARLGLKSTLEETRTAKLLSIATQDWGAGRPEWQGIHLMPMPLRYGGAHTHRLAGDWGMNMQNMPTVRGSKGKSKLRQSLIVSSDEAVVTCDLSQIEARLCAWICGCEQLVQEFRDNKDPYSLLATDIFGMPINRKLKDADGRVIYEIEGFIGKTGILGLGYGCGKENFNTMVTRSARSMGMDISQKYTREIGDKSVDTYRNRYSEIPKAWWKLNSMIATHWLSGSSKGMFGPCEITYGNVSLPNGLSLRYADPKEVMDDWGNTEFRYRYGKSWHKLYGAKLLENIVQALARIVVMNAALRIQTRGFNFVLQAHDELVFIVKKNNLDEAKKIIHEEMTRRPSWAPTAPIDAELGEGASYGAAK